MQYYDELGLDSSATSDEISAAFRRLAKKFHPDLNVGREHEVFPQFVRAQKAFEVLSDPARRAHYDAQFDTGSPWGSPLPTATVYEIQPLPEFYVAPSSMEPAITLPRIRRRLDPQLRKVLIFVGGCIVLAMLLVLFAS
jgi:curved DNA-binding protein CbpA